MDYRVRSACAEDTQVVFLPGLFFKRINGKGAVTGLAIGFIAGMAKAYQHCGHSRGFSVDCSAEI